MGADYCEVASEAAADPPSSSAASATRESMRARVGNSPEAEFQTALGEIDKIARIRLGDVLAP